MEPLRYAIIGCGKVAVKHLKAALYQVKANHALKIVALVDTQPQAIEKLLTACKIPDVIRQDIRIFPDYQTMLSEARPDLVAVTTPSGSHTTIGLAVIAAGAHLLLEKPLTLSLPEADQLLKAADTQGVKIAVGHIYRFFPLVADLQKDLAAGRFGRILYGDVKVRWGHDQAYYDQAGWRGTWGQDGGALMNQSVHALDLMIFLLGKPVLEVSGCIDRQIHQMEAEDLGFGILRMQDGIWCSLEGTTNTDPHRQEAAFFVRCTEGELRAGILSGRPSITVLNKNGKNITGHYLWKLLRTKWKQGGLGALIQLKSPHSGLYDDFVKAIQTDRPPLAHGESGRNAVEVVLALYQAAQQKKAISLPITDFSLQDMQGTFPEK